jgi:hypothetical protein
MHVIPGCFASLHARDARNVLNGRLDRPSKDNRQSQRDRDTIESSAHEIEKDVTMESEGSHGSLDGVRLACRQY